MKRISLFVTLILITYGSLSAQSLETGIQLYRDSDYDRALVVFEQSDDAMAQLFLGKTHFAMGHYLKARHVLNDFESERDEISSDALFTKALAEFQLKNFSQTLEVLQQIKSTYPQTSVHSDAVRFYNTVLNYLTLAQRYSAFNSTSNDTIRLDLLESAVGREEYGTVKAMYNAYRSAIPQTASNRNRLSSIGSLLSDSVSYVQRYTLPEYPEAPQGISYNVGVALPQFSESSDEYEITQNLYFGIQLAVDRFNSERSGRKVFLNYHNTESDPGKVSSLVNQMIWSEQADAIIGPVFSELATGFSRYAELYEVPVLLPLANSDSINMDYNYTFQFNPTFAVQGRKMAAYAFQNLRYDTVAVIAEKSSLGEPSAEAFYEEFSRLGGTVIKYDIRDLESEGYDIQEYTSYLNPENDTTFNVNIDAIYAPFTGVVASTLISSLLTEIEAANSDITVLGSEEWAASDLSALGLNTTVYYSESINIETQNMDRDEFESEFRLRFDTEPNRFAYIGYDVAKVLLNTLERVGNPAYLRDGLKSIDNYHGFSMDVNFNGGHINEAVNIRRLQTGN